jgi:hypothetical protein
MASNYDRRTKRWKRHTTYSIWYNMLARCYNDEHHAYKDYGGRGIRVCDRWRPSAVQPKPQAFGNFIEDMGERPSQHYSLDRNNADGNYEKSNCSWETSIVQGRNKRDTIMIPDPDNPEVQIPAAELAERRGVRYQTLRYQMLKEGTWPSVV